MNKDKIKNMECQVIQVINNMYFMLAILVISIIILTVSLLEKEYNGAFIGISVFFLYSTIYAFANRRKSFLLLIMNLMLFTFVLSRPTIAILKGLEWWNFPNIDKALIAIFITEVFLLVGAKIADKIIKKSKKTNAKKKETKQYISTILLVLVLVTAVVNLCTGMIDYINMKDLDYASVYTKQSPTSNIIIRILNAMFSGSVYAYLATMPKKKNSIIVLLIYSILAIPSFLLGSRNVLVSRILLAVIYVVIRDIIEHGNEVWITKKIKIIAIALVPIVIAFLGAYNYIRDDKEVPDDNLILDFFYKQGTTFDTICQGFAKENELKNQPNVISYSFGDIIDYAIHNSISQKIFHTSDLGNGNNLMKVTQSNSLAHRLSYLMLSEESYLEGHGRGTSYIIETYMDAGMIWLAIYSTIIGMYLEGIIEMFKTRKFLGKYIILTSLSQIFLLPRYSASGFFTFLITPQFWVIPVILFIITEVVEKRNKECKE